MADPKDFRTFPGIEKSLGDHEGRIEHQEEMIGLVVSALTRLVAGNGIVTSDVQRLTDLMRERWERGAGNPVDPPTES